MRMSLIVLYCSSIEESRRFYATLGLDLVREQHGAGPVHYAAELPDGLVLELYPAPAGGPVTRVRLGFAVPDPAPVMERLRAARFTVKRSNLVVDPDGNRLEIREEAGE